MRDADDPEHSPPSPQPFPAGERGHGAAAVGLPAAGSSTADDLAQAWDARVTRLTGHLPPRGQRAVEWLRAPERRPARIGAGLLLVLGGVFSILPVLGLWMLPLGLALIAQDVPALKAPLERAARWIEAEWARVKRRWHSS